MTNVKLKGDYRPSHERHQHCLAAGRGAPAAGGARCLIAEFPYAVDAIDFALADLVGRTTIRLRPLQTTLDLLQVSYIATANNPRSVAGADPAPLSHRDVSEARGRRPGCALPAVIVDLAKERGLERRWMVAFGGTGLTVVAQHWRGGSVHRAASSRRSCATATAAPRRTDQKPKRVSEKPPLAACQLSRPSKDTSLKCPLITRIWRRANRQPGASAILVRSKTRELLWPSRQTSRTQALRTSK